MSVKNQPIISLVVAHADNRIIGKNNQMPWHLPADLAHFKRVTLNKPVVMGRKTFESIGRPLPQRRNIVISRNADFSATGVEVVSSLDAALQAVSQEPEVMIIGGGSIYQAAIAFADKLYITKIALAVEGDTQFPAYDEVNDWQLVAQQAFVADEKTPANLLFCEYLRKT